MMPDYNIYVNAAPGIANTSYLTQFKVRVIDSSGSYIDVFTNGSVSLNKLEFKAVLLYTVQSINSKS